MAPVRVSAGKSNLRPVRTAVSRNTWSPQTIGLALPSPGIGTFHLTWFVSLHCTGGSPYGAMPLAKGPRHWCHWCWHSEEKSAAETVARTAKKAGAITTRRMTSIQGVSAVAIQPPGPAGHQDRQNQASKANETTCFLGRRVSSTRLRVGGRYRVVCQPIIAAPTDRLQIVRQNYYSREMCCCEYPHYRVVNRQTYWNST